MLIILKLDEGVKTILSEPNNLVVMPPLWKRLQLSCNRLGNCFADIQISARLYLLPLFLLVLDMQPQNHTTSTQFLIFLVRFEKPGSGSSLIASLATSKCLTILEHRPTLSRSGASFWFQIRNTLVEPVSGFLGAITATVGTLPLGVNVNCFAAIFTAWAAGL